MKNIGIIGCGWLGQHLANYLKTDNSIFATVTSDEKKNTLTSADYRISVEQFPDYRESINTWKCLDELDVIITTVPFSKRSGLDKVQHRFENISQFISGFKGQLFLMSSTGIYPQVDIDIRENSFPYQELEPTLSTIEIFMKDQFPQTNILRLAGLMGGSRVFSNFASEVDEQPVNHVHYEDICHIVGLMILKDIVSKTYNVVAPQHPSKASVYNFQKRLSELNTEIENVSGRRIIGDLLIHELEYKYIHPDPVKF